MNGTVAVAPDRPTTPANDQQQLQQQQQQQRLPRQSRKPSPGLAARLKALGFGSEKGQSTSPSPLNDRIGRIPEHQIRQLDDLHQAAASQSIERRGRAWSGASGGLTPQVTGGSFSSSPAGRLTPQVTGGSFAVGDYKLDIGRRRTISTTASENAAMNTPTEEEMDGQKYRLPDHINGNGTKATPETKKAHIESAPPYDESQPPTPLPKDMPAYEDNQSNFNGESDNDPNASGETDEFPEEVQSFFNPLGSQRPGSIYTLSRVSFANQLAQLTSLELPDADSLESTIREIPTAHVANTKLIGIAMKIRGWTSRASELLNGLDADDDVEWAAAGGREGLEEVDSAVSRFGKLINVYVGAIDQLQSRPDVGDVSKSKMATLITQTESILSEWGQIRSKLKGVKEQVELAMEFEDIWNVVLGDIGNEMGALNRLVFEIEERRHKTIMIESSGGIDPAELDTIVEEYPQPSPRPHASNRFLPTGFPMSPSSPDTPTMAEDDSSLMALSARLQPLHASLTFVPIRLSTYIPRAEKLFPTACQELETRREGLEKDWLRLKADADALQQELGEDKWIQVFRNANSSAERMVKSIEKTISKITESFAAGQHLTNPNGMAKKVDAYLKRKMHFGPAIEKVLLVIGNGLKDRLTVNGEISRMHQDTQARWDALRERLYEVDKIIEDLQTDDDNPQLRDSMSTMMSLDTFSLAESSGSSPASSVIETTRAQSNGNPSRGNKRSSLPKFGGGIGRRSASGSNQGVGGSSQKTPTSRLHGYFPSPSSASSSRQASQTPTSSGRIPRPSPSVSNFKPRWNSSVKTDDHLLRSHSSLSFSTPPPPSSLPTLKTSRSISYTPGSGASKESKIPLRSPLSREASSSPMPFRSDTPSRSRNPSLSAPSSKGRKVSFSGIKTTPGPYSQQVLSRTRPNLNHKPSMSDLGASSNIRSSFLASSKRHSILPSIEKPDAINSSPSSPLAYPPPERRAASSMAVSRRSSMLPVRGRQLSATNGRESPQAIAGATAAMKMRRESSIMSSGSGGSGASGDKARWR